MLRVTLKGNIHVINLLGSYEDKACEWHSTVTVVEVLSQAEGNAVLSPLGTPGETPTTGMWSGALWKVSPYRNDQGETPEC